MKKNCIALLFALAPLAVQAAPQYRIEYLQGSGLGEDINNNGLILQTEWVGGVARAFVGSTSSIADLGTLGGSTARGVELNDHGVVIGQSAIAGDGASHAFVYANGTMRDLGTLGGTNSTAKAVNNAGVVAGDSDIAGGGSHAFVYTAEGGMRDIGTLGGAASRVLDISESGDVLGQAQTASGDWHTFLYKDGVMTDVNGRYGSMFGFGPNGELYGASYSSSGMGSYSLSLSGSSWSPQRGFGMPTAMADGYLVGYDGMMANTLLATPEGTFFLDQLLEGDWFISRAVSVNDRGQILVIGNNSQVLLSPIPEPTTYAMLGAGLALLALRRRKGAGRPA